MHPSCGGALFTLYQVTRRSRVILGVMCQSQMADKTRQIDHRYFVVDEFTVGRTETQRGDFDSYDGTVNTTSVVWWIETRGQRSPASVAEIERLIRNTNTNDIAAVAVFFAESRGYDTAIVPAYAQFVDFTASFGRDPATIYPRLNDRALHFIARKTSCKDWLMEQEFWDIKVNLDTAEMEAHCFWSGNLNDVTRRMR